MSSLDLDFSALYRGHLDIMMQRLEDALAAAGFDGLVIFAGELRIHTRDDSTYPFRVEPYFAAWLPLLETPGCVLILAPGKRPVLIYRQDDDFWQVPPGDPQGYWTEHFDIEIARSSSESHRLLERVDGRYAAIGAMVDDDTGYAAVNDDTLLRHLDFFRAYKTEYEVACMERATTIAATGHRALGAAFGAGVSEFHLNEVYLRATQQRESELPYASIVALNRHAAVLHYQMLDRAAPATTRSLLVDAGAQFNGYAADVSRTWSLPDARFDELLRSMETMQRTLCAEVESGVDFVALNERAHELLAGILSDLDLVTCGPDEAYLKGITRTFLPHGLGHLLGLQVHDVGGHQTTPVGDVRAAPELHPFLRLTRVLEPGFALTIEPGIYFIDSLLESVGPAVRRLLNWELIEQLLPYGGIRIEDNLIVESTRTRNLTRAAFAALDGE